MNISVLGCGRWGSFIGWYLVNNGHNVIQWGRTDSQSFNVLKNTGKNEYVELDKRINLTDDLKFAVDNSDIIIISISAQGLRGFMQTVMECDISNKKFVFTVRTAMSEVSERKVIRNIANFR